jgi:hypothetical protein
VINSICIYIYTICLDCTRGEQTPQIGQLGPMPTPIAIWAHGPQPPHVPQYAQTSPSGPTYLLATRHHSARVPCVVAAIPRVATAVPHTTAARVCRPPRISAPTSSASGRARPPCSLTCSRRCSSILSVVAGMSTMLIDFLTSVLLHL